MNGYENTLLITDADGTLLTDDKCILDIDKTAILEFIQGGGLFTVATGRGTLLAQVVADELRKSNLLRLPMVIFNGAAVYDFEQERFLWKQTLCENAMKYIKRLFEAFPSIAVEILIDNDVYVTRTNKYEEDHLSFGALNPIRCGFDEIPKDGWVKVLLIDSPEMIDKVIEFDNANKCEYVHTVRSYTTFYEVLPKGIDKWAGIKKLIELLEYKDKKVITVGDYMNDIEMLRQSDFGIATANSEEEVKAVADGIVCDNNSGIIKDVLKLIDNNVESNVV